MPFVHDEFLNQLSLKTLNEVRSMNVFCHDHPLAFLRPYLTSQKILTATELQNMNSGRIVKVTGMMVIVHMPPTRSKKRVIFVTLEDETGLLDLAIFQNTQKAFAKDILTAEILTVQGKLQRVGKNGLSMSILVQRVIRELSGPLSKFLPYSDFLGKTQQSSNQLTPKFTP